MEWERIDSPWHEVPALSGTGRVDTSDDTLYRPLDGRGQTSEEAVLVAVPYFAWANRREGAMWVLVPLTD